MIRRVYTEEEKQVLRKRHICNKCENAYCETNCKIHGHQSIPVDFCDDFKENRQ